MKDIDEILRSAKPAVPELPDDFSKQLMLRIEKEKIQIQPVVAIGRVLQFRTVLGLGALLLAIILFSYNAYELRMNGSLELLFFGTQFLGDFIGHLPWDLIIPSILLTAFSVWMINKSNLLKKGMAVTAIAAYLLTGVGGVAIASTGLNDRIEEQITKNEGDWPWLSVFHCDGAKRFIQHPNFKMGKVKAIIDGNARIVTPHGNLLTVRLPEGTRVTEGDILRISGEGKATEFTANRVHICDPDRAMRYFCNMREHSMMRDNMN